MSKNNYYPANKGLGIDIPDVLQSNTELDFLDEEDFDEAPTYRSIKEATGQNGYIDLSKEIIAQASFDPTQKTAPTFFDLSESSEVTRNIVEDVKKNEFTEKCDEWSKILAPMNSKLDHKAVCSFIDMGVIFERLMEVIEITDDVYSKFTKEPSLSSRHLELLTKIKEDLMNEEKIIDEYKEELKRLG